MITRETKETKENTLPKNFQHLSSCETRENVNFTSNNHENVNATPKAFLLFLFFFCFETFCLKHKSPQEIEQK